MHTINMEKERTHSTSIDSPSLYFVRPFKETTPNVSRLRTFIKEFKWLCRQRESIKILFYIFINLTGTILLLIWCRKSSSLALLAYTYLSWFNFLSLLTCLLSVWIEAYVANFSFTFGLVTCEILAVFSSVTLTILGALFVLKESVQRLIQPEYLALEDISLVVSLALIFNLTMVAVAQNPALKHIIKSSPSSMLQDHVLDMCFSVCSYFPKLKALILPRLNPLVLISFTGHFFIIGDQIIVQVYNYPRGDTIVAILISLSIVISMFPLCICSANLLLQTIPVSHLAYLDKCLREALTVDGVLEFRNENFWVLGVGYRTKNHIPSGMMNGSIVSGTLHVRVRRDANEQLVLKQVRDLIQPLVPLLTVQVFKDDWTRSSTTLQLLNESVLSSPKLFSNGFQSPPFLYSNQITSSFSYSNPIGQENHTHYDKSNLLS